jgi:hypothetical protein
MIAQLPDHFDLNDSRPPRQQQQKIDPEQQQSEQHVAIDMPSQDELKKMDNDDKKVEDDKGAGGDEEVGETSSVERGSDPGLMI